MVFNTIYAYIEKGEITMKKIILVAESGSDITKEMAAQYDIHIVPMHVTFGDETTDDGSFPVEKIVNYYKETGKLPKTSGSNPGDFEIFNTLHEKYPEAHILYLAYSAVTTVSYQSAKIMAEGRDFITLIDTKQVSVGQGAIVVEVAKYIKANPEAKINEVVEYTNELIERARMCFVPANLEFLKAGGRVSNAAYIGATILNLHPTIEILDGRLTATKKYRGNMPRTCAKLIREYSENYNLDKDILWCIYTIGLTDEVKDAAKAQIEELGFKDVTWVQAHGVITTHGGPGAFGIAGFTKK